MKKITKTIILLLGLVIMLGFTKCAMANNIYNHHNAHSNNILNLAIMENRFKNSHYYYNPYMGKYNNYPDYRSYKKALKSYYKARKELINHEKFVYKNVRAERY